MSEPRFTKGPWYIGRTNPNFGPKIYSPNGWLIADCAGAIPRQKDEVEANASLVASAPELYSRHDDDLAELDLIKSAVLHGVPASEIVASIAQMQRRKRAALAKAGAAGGEG